MQTCALPKLYKMQTNLVCQSWRQGLSAVDKCCLSWNWRCHLGSLSQTPKCAGIMIAAPPQKAGIHWDPSKKLVIPDDPRCRSIKSKDAHPNHTGQWNVYLFCYCIGWACDVAVLLGPRPPRNLHIESNASLLDHKSRDMRCSSMRKGT